MKIGRKKYGVISYADSFRTLTTHVRIPVASPDRDRRSAIYDALRSGRCYMAYECLGDPRSANFRAICGDQEAEMGGRITLTGPVRFEASAGRATGSIEDRRILLRLYHRGKIVASGDGGRLTFTGSLPGPYRLEVYRYHHRVGPCLLGARPWIFTNPIYVDPSI